MTWCEFISDYCDNDPETCQDCPAYDSYDDEVVVVSNRTITKLSLTNMDFSS